MMTGVVKTFMVAGERERFSDLLLQTRVVRTVPIRHSFLAGRTIRPAPSRTSR
jgi:hypothetical protein